MKTLTVSKQGNEHSMAGRRVEALPYFKECIASPYGTYYFKAIVFFVMGLDWKRAGIYYTRVGMHLMAIYARERPEDVDEDFKDMENEARDLLRYQQSEAARRAAKARVVRKAQKAKAEEAYERAGMIRGRDRPVDSDDDDEEFGGGIKKLAIGSEIEGPPTSTPPATANTAPASGNRKKYVLGRGKI